MTKPMIRIHNTETDEIIDREMNDEEFAQWEKDKSKHEQTIADEEIKQALRTSGLAKLQDLGLTEDEAKAFLG